MLRINSSSFWVFSSVILIQAVTAMVNLGITPLLPFIKADLNLNIVQLGYLVAAIQLGNGLGSFPSGFLVDIFGVKKILLYAGFFLGIASISFYWLNLYIIILIFLFLTGIFYSSISPSLSKAIIQLFPAKIRGTMMGIKQTSISISAFIAALWFPYIAIKHGWRMGYFLVGCLVILLTLTALFYKKPSNERGDQIFKKSRMKNMASIIQNDSIRTVCFTIPFFFMAQFIPAAYLMVDVNDRFDIPIIKAGYLLALLQFGSIIGRIIFGMLGDWLFLQKRELLLALISLLAGFFIIIFAFIAIPNFLLLGIVVFFLGFTGAGWNSIFLVFVTEAIETGFVGLASGLTMSIGYLASTVAIPIFGKLTQIFNGFVVPWTFLAICMLISSFTYFRLSLRNKKNVHFSDVQL